MTTWQEANNLIRAKFDDLAGSYSWTVIWDNAPEQDIPNGPFVEFYLLPGETQQVTFGAEGTRRFRSLGIAQASFWVIGETGDDDIETIATATFDEFKATTEDGITYRTPSQRRLGRSGRHYGLAVSIPFWFEELS